MVWKFVDFFKVSEFRDNNGAFDCSIFNLFVIKLTVRGFICEQIFLGIDSADAIFNNVVDDHLKLLIIASF
jgi:hypothetical protein